MIWLVMVIFYTCSKKLCFTNATNAKDASHYNTLLASTSTALLASKFYLQSTSHPWVVLKGPLILDESMRLQVYSYFFQGLLSFNEQP